MVKQTKVICGLLTVSAVLGNCVIGQAVEEINNPVTVEQRAIENSGTKVQADDGAIDKKQPVADKKSSKKKNKKNKKKVATAATPPAPITIEGEELSFNDVTGNVYAKGKVIVKQALTTLLADDIRGNTKHTEVQIDGKANMTQPGLNLDGYATFYNYQAHTGNMSNAQGLVDFEKHVQGERVEILPDEYIIYNGTVTKCPAKKPDYHIRAKKIEIWPNNKLIAYDAQFLIKGAVIYSTPRYETKIGDNKDDSSPFPRIGYNSDNGVYIIQKFQVPLSDSITAETNIGYYSKFNFKNDYQIAKWDRNYSLLLKAGDYQDSDNNWVKKEPELDFTYAAKRIAGGPWQYSFSAIYGKWTDDYKSSWHQDYTLYFSRDPIKLSQSLSLVLGTGYEIVKESYNGSQINTMKYDATFYKNINKKLGAYIGYHYTENNSQVSLFNYNNSSVGQELASGFSYRFDNKNSIVFSQSYDLANKQMADRYYTWNHNLHCWNMSVTYHQDIDGNKNNTSVKFSVVNW